MVLEHQSVVIIQVVDAFHRPWELGAASEAGTTAGQRRMVVSCQHHTLGLLCNCPQIQCGDHDIVRVSNARCARCAYPIGKPRS